MLFETRVEETASQAARNRTRGRATTGTTYPIGAADRSEALFRAEMLKAEPVFGFGLNYSSFERELPSMMAFVSHDSFPPVAKLSLGETSSPFFIGGLRKQ